MRLKFTPYSGKAPVIVLIKEKALVARIACKVIGGKSVAIVFGRTICLHNTTARQFITNTHWLRHELEHVLQYERHGYFGFICRYLWESMRSGYYNNKFEKEARGAEHDTVLLQAMEILT